MDIPATMQDWWIYLIPGGLVVAEVFFLYGALTHLLFPASAFRIGGLFAFVQTYSVPAVIGLGAAGLVAGSILEGTSASLFGRLQSDGSIQEEAEIALKKMGLIPAALRNTKLLPESIRPSNSDEPTRGEWTAIWAYLEALVYAVCNEREVDNVEETATARTFTQCFFTAFLLSPSIPIWLLVRGMPVVAGLLSLLLLAYGAYLWSDSSTLGRIYYEKVLRVTYAHVSSGSPSYAN